MIFSKLVATLSKKKLITEGTTELTFSVSAPSFIFKSGQYVSICIPSLSEESVPDRCHDFSIASSPMNAKEISIALRDSQSIFKTTLLSLPLGSVVDIDGPKGILTLPDDTGAPLIFVAGGIGITPLLSMLRSATETSSPQKITLLYFNSKKETTAYTEELSALAMQNKNFSFVEALGTPEVELFIPYIQEGLCPRVFAEGVKPAGMRSDDLILWYVVGTPKMVTSVKQILVGSGILDAQIQTEEFSGYDKQ